MPCISFKSWDIHPNINLDLLIQRGWQDFSLLMCYSQVPVNVNFPHITKCFLASPIAQWVKNPPVMQETQEMRVRSLGWEDLLEKGMATHSSILAWRSPWTEEPGGLQSIELQRVWATKHTHQKKKKVTALPCSGLALFSLFYIIFF